MRRIFFLVPLILCLFIDFNISAQTNVITNGGFEAPHSTGYLRKVANGWTAWVGAGTGDFYPEQYGSVYAGAYSQAILAELPHPDAGVMGLSQTVGGIPAGSRIRATVTGSIFMAGSYTDDEFKTTGARLQIGIDPNGGTNPNDGDIVWSGELHSSSGVKEGDSVWRVSYRQITVETTSTGPSVTVFLRAIQQWSSLEQRYFFDNASLVVLEEGTGTTPDDPDGGTTTVSPTAVPVVASSFASQQEAQEDGSIIHTVQAGNTLYAIAAVYKVNVDEIRALNPSIGDGRILQPGDQLLIRPAQTDAAESTEEATIEPDATDEEPVATEEDAAAAGDDPDATTEPVASAVVVASNTPRPVATQVPTLPPATATPITPATAPVNVADANVDAASPAGESVCVTIFENTINVNGGRERSDVALRGGTIDLMQGDAKLPPTFNDASDALCFENLAVGEYMLHVSAPPGYVTNSSQMLVRVQSGDNLNIPIDATKGEIVAIANPPSNDTQNQATDAQTSPAEDDNNQTLQIIGLIAFAMAGFSLVGGIVIALIMRRS
jgi:LysM repeat protein